MKSRNPRLLFLSFYERFKKKLEFSVAAPMSEFNYDKVKLIFNDSAPYSSWDKCFFAISQDFYIDNPKRPVRSVIFGFKGTDKVAAVYVTDTWTTITKQNGISYVQHWTDLMMESFMPLIEDILSQPFTNTDTDKFDLLLGTMSPKKD